ncbi:hypothetical protein [Nocardia sp. NPDC049707]
MVLTVTKFGVVIRSDVWRFFRADGDIRDTERALRIGVGDALR